jgi:hypothetical protein
MDSHTTLLMNYAGSSNENKFKRKQGEGGWIQGGGLAVVLIFLLALGAFHLAIPSKEVT